MTFADDDDIPPPRTTTTATAPSGVPAVPPPGLTPAQRENIEKQIAQIESQLSTDIQAKLSELNGGGPSGKPAETANKSPHIAFAGVTLGTTAGRVTGTGGDASMQGGLRARAFGEGASGPNTVDYSGWNELEFSYQRQIDALAELKASLLNNPSEHDQKSREIRAELETRFRPQLERYRAELNRQQDYQNARPSRPLYVAELDLGYNMVGAKGLGTSTKDVFTGATGHAKGGVGFAMKEYGKNGCTMYFLLQGNVDGAAYYKLENADSAQFNVGVEQGPLCQIGHAVTVMLSPSVQIGQAIHALPEGGFTDSGILDFAGHARVIVDGKVYIAANGMYHPAMNGSTWSSSQLDTTADFKVSDSWFVGLDGKATQYDNTACPAKGTSHVVDDRVTATATLVF